MSGPKNNLEDVRRKKTLNAPDAPVPQVQQKSFKFKPAVASVATSNVTIRKVLPSFSTPGFGKSIPDKTPTLAQERETIDISISSNESPPRMTSAKRISSVSSVTSDPSPACKRIRKQDDADKENMSKPTTKGKEKAPIISPRQHRRSPSRTRTDGAELKPWLKMPLPVSNPFVSLDRDWPLSELTKEPKPMAKPLVVGSEFENAASTPISRSCLSPLPSHLTSVAYTAGSDLTDVLSRYPDLRAKSPESLKKLLLFNYEHNRKNDEVLFQSFSTDVMTADIYMLNAFKKLLHDRISAIQELLLRPDACDQASPTVGGHMSPARKPASTAVSRQPSPSPSSIPQYAPPTPLPSGLNSSLYVRSTSGSCPSHQTSDNSAFALVTSTPTSSVMKSTVRKPIYEAADAGGPPVPQSDDLLWDSVPDIWDEDFDELQLDAPVSKPRTPAPAIKSVPIPRIERVDQTSTSFYAEAMRVLKNVFGLHSFRTNQLEAINATLSGRDVFVLMPTGGGKSLCFQVPAVCTGGKTRGVTFVVSPLIALMQDQVHALETKGVDVVLWNSERTGDDVQAIKQRLLAPRKPAMVYVTPEKLKDSQALKNTLARLYRDGELARFVIDEAHCISSWGRDFRDAYLELNNLREDYPDVPIMALTATAKTNVVDDIIQRLKMRDPMMLKQSFNRPNLHYDVRLKPKNVLSDIAAFIKSRYLGECGIIYALSRKSCEEIAKDLREKFNLKAKHYHAKMNPQDKGRTQHEWQSGRCDIIVATIAFGMGIDKPNVRYVIHYTIPKSLDGYYQETGRAGRDGNASECVLFFSFSDVNALVRMISEGNKENGKLSPEEERRQKEDVYAVVSYCYDTITCRRVQVLRYFGEVYDAQGCHGGCNNCTHDGVVCEKDFTQLAHDAAALVKEILVSSTQPTTQNLLQDAFIGLNHKEIKRRGYVQFALHGAGKGMSREDVVRLFNKLLELSVLQYVSVANACGYHSTYVELGPKMDEFLKKRPTITLPVREENSAYSVAPKKPRKATRPKEPKPMPKARRVAAIDVEEEAIGFYEDEDDSLQHLFPEDDAIEPPSPKKRPRAVPTAQRQGSPSRNGKGEDFPQASLEDGSWNSLYTELKVACYAGIKGGPEETEAFIPDTTLQYIALVRPTDPFTFLQALRVDSPIDDPAELDAFVKDRDAKLRKTVLTICMKHAVHASQSRSKKSTESTKGNRSFDMATLRDSYTFKPPGGAKAKQDR